jgi:hypothetical protein
MKGELMVFWRKRKPRIELSIEADQVLREAVEEHNRKNDLLARDWSFNSIAEWNCDQDTGQFVMVTRQGTRVLADFQAVGSFEKRTQSWEWAWNNPHIDKRLSVDSRKVKSFGEKEGINYLTLPMFTLPKLEFATYLAAIASRVTNAQGAFPGDIGELVLWVTLKNLRHTS